MTLPEHDRPILAFGAHPDDIEFGCGAILATEAARSHHAHFVIGSRGESGTHGTPAQRIDEAKRAAQVLGATIEFVELGGDARITATLERVLALAAIIRRMRPRLVFAPTVVKDQHPDHVAVGTMVRDAARLARYGGVPELAEAAPHAIGTLFCYAITAEAEPAGATPLLVDVSSPDVVERWKSAMDAHVSQSRTRNYTELQLTRARLYGLRAGTEHAWPIWPNEPLVVDSLQPFSSSARRF